MTLQVLGLICLLSFDAQGAETGSAPVITNQPTGLRRPVGGAATFRVGVRSEASVSYQWQVNGTNLPAATNAALIIESIEPHHAAQYSVVVSNTSGSVTSSVARLALLPKVAFVAQPSSRRVLAGTLIGFGVAVSNATYRTTNFWQVNGKTVAASQHTNHWFFASADQHGRWTAISSNEAGAVTSEAWEIEVVLPGQVIGWGDNQYGQASPPYLLTNVIGVATADHHTLLLKEDGRVVGWGAGTNGENKSPPGLADVVAVGAGQRHSLALQVDGKVVAWGDNHFGQTNVPANLGAVKSIAAGHWHNLALQTNGRVAAWGRNAHGQTSVPNALRDIVAIAAGGEHSLALQRSGSVAAWGLNTSGQCSVPGRLTKVVAIAAGKGHSLALKADGTVVAWGDNRHGQATPPRGLSNAIAIAAGAEFNLALKRNNTIVTWGRADTNLTDVPAPLGDIRAIAAGSNHALALIYSPLINYCYEPADDLLVIYNTRSRNSIAVKDYYLSKRPKIASANVLGIACTPGEYIARPDFTNQIWAPVLKWLNRHPTRRPNFVVLCYDVPSRFPLAWLEPKHQSDFFSRELTGSIAYELRRRFPSPAPLVTALNMQTRDDCVAYINKLAAFGSNLPLHRVLISPSATGYANETFVLDNVRSGYTNFFGLLRNARSNLLQIGVSSNNIVYHDNWAGALYSDNWPTNRDAIRHATNVAAYIGWGQHAGRAANWPTNRNAGDGKPYIEFYGDSNWFLAQSVESWNGLWPRGSMGTANQSSFQMWFSRHAFGGTNYENTAVGAVSHTAEPSLPGVNEPKVYFGLWYLGKNAAIAAWASDVHLRTIMHATGDPWVVR